MSLHQRIRGWKLWNWASISGLVKINLNILKSLKKKVIVAPPKSFYHDQCNNDFCGPHGRCFIDFETKVPVCQCHQGFEGKLCNKNIDECQANECKNGASCIDKNDGYECICRTGWTGNNDFIHIHIEILILKI